MSILKLKELALAATQGKWRLNDPSIEGEESDCYTGGRHVMSDTGCGIAGTWPESCELGEQNNANAVYIAEACPANILQLIDSNHQLLDAAKKMFEAHHSGQYVGQAARGLRNAISKAEAMQ